MNEKFFFPANTRKTTHNFFFSRFDSFNLISAFVTLPTVLMELRHLLAVIHCAPTSPETIHMLCFLAILGIASSPPPLISTPSHWLSVAKRREDYQSSYTTVVTCAYSSPSSCCGLQMHGHFCEQNCHFSFSSIDDANARFQLYQPPRPCFFAILLCKWWSPGAPPLVTSLSKTIEHLCASIGNDMAHHHIFLNHSTIFFFLPTNMQ